MKKFILLILFPVIISGCAFASKKVSQQGSNENMNTIATGKLSKTYCDSTKDCVISSYDQDGFQTCVNKDWNIWLNEDPQSRGGVLWECIEQSGLKCDCIDNICKRTDSNNTCDK